MATSNSSVASQASVRLGAGRIQSLTGETGDNAVFFNEIFADTRDAVLQMYPWPFATRRATLARLSSPPITMGSARQDLPNLYYFQLPNDYLQLVETSQDFNPYKVENNGTQLVMVSDQTSINIRYIARIEDPTRWPPLFTEALIAKLAAEGAVPLKGRIDRAQFFEKVFEGKLKMARFKAGQEGSPDTLVSSELVDTRQSGMDWLPPTLRG